jgi:hypothetical protein
MGSREKEGKSRATGDWDSKEADNGINNVIY